MGFVEVNTQVMKLYLRLCPSQGERAIHSSWPAIFIREFHHLFPCRGDHGRKDYPRRGPGRNLYRSPQTDNRVEYRADSAGEGPPVDDRHWVAHRVPAPDKSRAVCLELRFARSFTL